MPLGGLVTACSHSRRCVHDIARRRESSGCDIDRGTLIPGVARLHPIFDNGLVLWQLFLDGLCQNGSAILTRSGLTAGR